MDVVRAVVEVTSVGLLDDKLTVREVEVVANGVAVDSSGKVVELSADVVCCGSGIPVTCVAMIMISSKILFALRCVELY